MSEKRVVIITGASRGLGAATARWLAKKSCALVLNARSEDALAEVSKECQALGAETRVVAGDVGDLDACKRIVAAATDKWGRLDALVNNAALIDPIGVYTGVDMEGWARAIQVNLCGPLFLSRLAAPWLLQSKGKIVNVSTGAAVHPLAAWSAYCASKAGLHHLTRCMAAEQSNIIAVSLRPGVIDTAMQDQIRREGQGHMPPDMLQYFTQLKETNRLEPPEVPAKSLAWLALYCPPEWNGEMIEYTDQRIVRESAAVFGD
jgi:NAD(P)-dependent dehydrogenase (short-subunit alcohol dehydrogenase family)